MIHQKVVIQELERKHGFGPAMSGGRTALLRDGTGTTNQLVTEKTWYSLCTGCQEVGVQETGAQLVLLPWSILGLRPL